MKRDAAEVALGQKVAAVRYHLRRLDAVSDRPTNSFSFPLQSGS